MTDDETVYVVDDDPGALKSMRWLLESDGLSVETFQSARQFLLRYDRNRTACLLLDLKMPEVDGLELQEILLSQGARIPIVFVSGHGDVSSCAAAMKRGAADFVEKPVDDDTILNLVRACLERDRERRLADAGVREIAARIEQLTDREREVMQLLHQGKSVKKIALAFRISFQTVAKHRARVLEKLGVQNEAELVRLLERCAPGLGKA